MMITIIIDNPAAFALPSGITATVGFFDGVHVGHRFLIDQLKKIADEKGLFSAVITFSVHPRKVLDKRFCPELLNSFEEKLYRLSTTGIDYCFVLDFTEALSNLTAREFIQEELYRKLNVKSLLVGYDHRFGKNREEGFTAYKQYGAEVNMDVIEAEPLFYEDANVSSTRIRNLLSGGEIEKITRLLSYHYTLKGSVVEGNRIGRTIGFPTANICPENEEKVIPGTGIYAVNVDAEGVSYKGMLYIGQRPTVAGNEERRIEVHLLDFSGDLYGKILDIEFVKFLREDRRFNSMNALKRQLKLDKKATLMSLILLILFFVFPIRIYAQESETPTNLSYHSTLIGGGNYSLYDTYLSGQKSIYDGWGVRVLGDYMKMTGFMRGNVSSQHLVGVDFSSTKNAAKTASDYTLFLDYSYGLHYHFKPLPALKLLAGAQTNALFGAIYNTRNGNNPISPKMAVNIGFSGIADYRFRIGRQPLIARYQLDVPFFGCMFSQDYGASFYEISLGNNDRLFLFASFHNQLIMKNYLTLELPLKAFTVRTTYLHHIYRTNVRDLQTHINSNTLMIGFVREFFSIPGRKQAKGHKYRRVFD